MNLVNSHPSSTLFCSPIKFIFVKENSEIVENKEIEVVIKTNKFTCLKTMLNGKCHIECYLLWSMEVPAIFYITQIP